MSSEPKTFIPTLIYIFIIVISSLFVYVFTKSEVRKMLRNKDLMQERLNEKINLVEASLVEKQQLSAENRIVELSQLNLSMIKNPNQPKVINIDKHKFLEIQELIKLKYE